MTPADLAEIERNLDLLGPYAGMVSELLEERRILIEACKIALPLLEKTTRDGFSGGESLTTSLVRNALELSDHEQLGLRRI